MNNIKESFKKFKKLDKEEINKVSIQIRANMFGYFCTQKSNKNSMTLEH